MKLRGWLCFGAIFFSISASNAQGAGETVMKMATLVPQGSEWHKILQEMGAEWQKASNGRIVFRLYPGGVAGDDQDIVRKMQLGTLDAGLLTIAGLSIIDRGVLGLEVPLAYADYAELDCVREQIASRLERRMEAKGFIVLGWSDGGWTHFFTRFPVRTPDDLKKLKMYVVSGDDQYAELVKNAGLNPVPLPSTEIATALQTGLVQAITMTSQGVLLLQWYKQLNHMTDLKWAVLMGGIVITKSAWEKIPAEVRPAMMQASLKASQRLQEFSRQADQADMEALKKNGVEVVSVDAKVLGEWRRLIEGVLPKVRGSYVPAELLDTALELRDQCRRHADKAVK
ncbi:MAG TPA: TRAP transporter substrate-binding protein DctP [Syntrophobacteraceae bacterium]|nr:TRAP transporter substrate-binding protein DctP [Syntrophobacteraceae bacterium]